MPGQRDRPPVRRRTTLTAVLLATAALAAVVLREVIATVFFALTVAYVSRPLYRWLRGRGVHQYVASGLTTLAVFLLAVVLTIPLVGLAYLRREEIVDVVEGLPEEFSVTVIDVEYTLEAGAAWSFVADQLQAIAFDVVSATPRLVLGFALFTVVVFGVLLGDRRIAAAIRAIVPAEYQDVLDALHRRIEDTLFAIYVVQLATAVATMAIGVVVFYLLGYEYFFSLSVVSGLLQFLPIVGPSLVVVALVVFHVTAGELVAAGLALLFAGVLVAALPDVVLRPQLASELADIPATLYFVGFFGGVLSVGVVGAIAGPLVLAVLVEVVSLLAAEIRNGETADADLAEFAEDEDSDTDREDDGSDDDHGDGGPEAHGGDDPPDADSGADRTGSDPPGDSGGDVPDGSDPAA